MALETRIGIMLIFLRRNALIVSGLRHCGPQHVMEETAMISSQRFIFEFWSLQIVKLRLAPPASIEKVMRMLIGIEEAFTLNPPP